MYNKKEIIKTLNEYNYFIEESVLDNFIKNWKIDAIYEDEDGVEFFDNLSIIKIKKGISLKAQGYSSDEIIYHINKLLAETPALEETKKQIKGTGTVIETAEALSLTQKPAEQTGEFKNLTVDVTSQTLQMLADAVAQKISTEIKQQLLLENPLRENNEALSKQVGELLEDNKKLAERIQQLEGKKFCFSTWLKNVIASVKK